MALKDERVEGEERRPWWRRLPGFGKREGSFTIEELPADELPLGYRDDARPARGATRITKVHATEAGLAGRRVNALIMVSAASLQLPHPLGYLMLASAACIALPARGRRDSVLTLTPNALTLGKRAIPAESLRTATMETDAAGTARVALDLEDGEVVRLPFAGPEAHDVFTLLSRWLVETNGALAAEGVRIPSSRRAAPSSIDVRRARHGESYVVTPRTLPRWFAFCAGAVSLVAGLRALLLAYQSEAIVPLALFGSALWGGLVLAFGRRAVRIKDGVVSAEQGTTGWAQRAVRSAELRDVAAVRIVGLRRCTIELEMRDGRFLRLMRGLLPEQAVFLAARVEAARNESAPPRVRVASSDAYDAVRDEALTPVADAAATVTPSR